jgi:hypothetical protein
VYEQRFDEEQVAGCRGAGPVGGAGKSGNLGLGNTAAEMRSGDDAEWPGVFVRIVKVNANGDQFIQDVVGWLAIGEVSTATWASQERVVGVRRNGDHDVLVTRHGPVGVRMFVEEDSVERKRGSPKRFRGEPSEPDVVKVCSELGPGI